MSRHFLPNPKISPVPAICLPEHFSMGSRMGFHRRRQRAEGRSCRIRSSLRLVRVCITGRRAFGTRHSASKGVSLRRRFAVKPIDASSNVNARETMKRFHEQIVEAFPISDHRNKKLLMIVPDGTRTAPVGTVFQAFFEHLGPVAGAIDVMVALGTHPPMSEEAICRRLEISTVERGSTYRKV